jgi:hypothetical protein
VQRVASTDKKLRILTRSQILCEIVIQSSSYGLTVCMIMQFSSIVLSPQI